MLGVFLTSDEETEKKETEKLYWEHIPVWCEIEFPSVQDIHENWITGKRYLNMDALQEWETGEENGVENKSNKGLSESHRKIRTLSLVASNINLV